MSKVLIIEDEQAIAELEKDYLELYDFEVSIEHDGQKPPGSVCPLPHESVYRPQTRQ